LARRDVGEIDVDHVGNRDVGYVALAARRCVLAGDVLREPPFNIATVANAEASAKLASGVSDDPDGGIAALARRSEP